MTGDRAAERAADRAADDAVLLEGFRRYRESQDRELRDELVAAHLGLAAAIARRFARRGEPLDDLVQVANYGLVRAVERFDPERGTSFAGFAVPTMMGEIKRHFRDHAWSGRVPRRAKELTPRLASAVEVLTGTLGRAPTVPEMAEHLGVSVDRIVEAIDAQQLYRPAALSSIAPERGEHPQVAEIDLGLAHVDDRITVERLLETLPQRERRIVELRFYEEMTQTQIAEIVGISQMHVSRLLRQALARLAAVVAEQRQSAARQPVG